MVYDTAHPPFPGRPNVKIRLKPSFRLGSNIQTGVARGVCESGDASVILITFTVESNGGNSGGQSALGNLFADDSGGGDVSAVRIRIAEIFFLSARARQRLPYGIVDNLGADMSRTAENTKSRTSTVSFNGVRDSEFAGLALFVQAKLFIHVNTRKYSFV